MHDNIFSLTTFKIVKFAVVRREKINSLDSSFMINGTAKPCDDSPFAIRRGSHKMASSLISAFSLSNYVNFEGVHFFLLNETD